MSRLFICIGIVAGWMFSLDAAGQAWPTSGWTDLAPGQVQMNETRLQEAAQYARQGGGAGMVSRHGYRVHAWGDQGARFDLKSTTKSIGATALGLALSDNRLSLSDAARNHLPGLGVPPAVNSSRGWLDEIEIVHLATHTAGFPKEGGYGPLLFRPGTRWSYSDGGVNWLADVLTSVYREDLRGLLFRRVFAQLGITPADLEWRTNRYREDTLQGVNRRELGSGIAADVDAMARIGHLYLREGNWEGEQLIPQDFAAAVRQPHPASASLEVADDALDPDSPRRYGLLWWTNADGSLPGVPADAFWSWGLGDSLIVVIPSLDVVAARAGPSGFKGGTWDGDYSSLEPFIAPIAQSVSGLQVPRLVGSTLPDAQAAITAAGLTLGNVSRRADASVAPGTVLEQSPVNGQAANGGSPVTLTVSGAPSAQFAAESGRPPSVRISTPGPDSWVSGTVAIAAVAADDSRIVEYSVAIDGVVAHSSTSGSLHFPWDSTRHANGGHTIRVSARSADGGRTDTTRRVTVDNYAGTDAVPYPASTGIAGFELAAPESMTSAAPGSDNWPVTWADDDQLYTAYGDGEGFRREVGSKLSLGFARLAGSPPDVEATNIRSASGEQRGHGSTGKKASGMLMVDGVLYMWVRNANGAGEQCQLAWSTDHAKTWRWSPWQFPAFGYCSFVNFGRDYAGSRNDFVYMYTPDSPSAYTATDAVVLTRVHKSRILQKSAYEFYAGFDAAGKPLWSPDIGDRRPVFEFPGGVNRLDVVYHPGLGRYLMTMRARDRAQSARPNHFSVYDAPEPWGPWTTVYYTNSFYGEPLPAADEGPGGWGESQRFPSKWIEQDGTALELLCSCSDSFSTVRTRLYPGAP